MTNLYPAKVNYPETVLTGSISAVDIIIAVDDVSKLPAASNLAVIGTGETAETVLYTGVSGDNLTGVTRGFQGTARAWAAGTPIGRKMTAYDHDAFIDQFDPNDGHDHAGSAHSGGPVGVILGHSAYVLSSDLPTIVKTLASLAKLVFGNRVQVCDGTDDDVEVHAARDALANGGTIKLVGSSFEGGPLTLKSKIKLEGEGFSTTYKLKDGANADVLSVAGTDDYTNRLYAEIRHLRIDGNRSNQTAGNGIVLKRGISLIVQDALVGGVYGYGIVLDDAIRARVTGNIIFDSGHGVLLKDAVFGQDIVAHNIVQNVNGYGFHLYAATKECVDNIVNDNIVREANDQAFRLEGETGWACAGNLLNGNRVLFCLNNTGRGFYLNGWAFGNNIVGNFVNDVLVGVEIDGAHSVQLLSNNISWVRKEGILCNGDDNVIHDNHLNPLGILTDNTYSGIVLGGSYNTVEGNQQFGVEANRPKYCLEELAGADYNYILNNKFMHARSALVVRVGANSVLRHNLGYLTENSGTSTGTGAEQTIAHGLAEIPNRLFLSNEADGANPYQSSAADATNIYITAVSGKAYQWKAEYV